MITDSWITPSLLGAALVLFTCYYLWFFTKLRRCGLPGPTPVPVFGNILEQVKKGFHATDKQWADKYGGVVGVYNGHLLTVHVTDPELLKRIFVKDFNSFVNRQNLFPVSKIFRDGLFFIEDDHWRLTRNIMSPTFSGVKLRQMIGIMNKCAVTLSDNLAVMASTEGSKSIKDTLGAFSLDVIASTAFGIEIDSQNEPDNEMVNQLKALFDGSFVTSSTLLVLGTVFPKLRSLLPKLPMYNTILNRPTEYLKESGMAIIKERKRNPTGRVDFLHLLLNAEYGGDETSTPNDHLSNGYASNGKLPNGSSANGSVSNGNNANGHHKKTVHKLDDDAVNAQALLFFAAGYETTSSLLRYGSYILALRPDVDEKLMDEIQDVLGDKQPTYDAIGKLKYMEMFINETLRMYPPASRLTRIANKDVTFRGMTIPKGTTVIIPIKLLHYNPEFFPEPEVFDPERFSAANKSRINPVTYIPFGYGPRNCIGMRLALVEAKLALVHMLRRVRFVRTAETEEKLTFKKSGLLSPTNPIKIGLELRTN